MTYKAFHKVEAHHRTDFPLSIYPCKLDALSSVGGHFHDHFEIIYITQGSAKIQIGEDIFYKEKGAILFANMYQIHSFESISSNTAIVQAIVFHRDVLDLLNTHYYYQKYIEPFLSGEQRFPPILEPETPLYTETKDSLDRILLENTTKAVAYEVFIKTEIEKMFANFSRHQSIIEEDTSHHISKANQELLNQVANYVETNYTTPISLDDIANHLGINKSYFCRLIKKLTGKSFTHFLNIYRVKEAEKLIKKTSYPVSIISEKVGFSNHSYFNRIFKTYTGMTPSDFRKQIN